jgi:hypothetical protein
LEINPYYVQYKQAKKEKSIDAEKALNKFHNHSFHYKSSENSRNKGGPDKEHL